MDKQRLVEVYLLKQILSGQLKPMQVLPPQRDIAKDLAISRPVVAKAIGKLESMGLLATKIRQGIIVNDFITSAKLSLIEHIIDIDKELIDLDMRQSMLDFLEGNMLLILKAVIRQGTYQPQYPSQYSHAQEAHVHKGPFDLFLWMKALAISSQNKIYPLLLNEFEVGIRNATIYVNQPHYKPLLLKAVQEIEGALVEQKNEESPLLETKLKALIAILEQAWLN